MADGFIVRRGGKGSEQALAPTITEVSTTQTSITFTITNNDAETAVILWEIGDSTPDANSIELAAAATSSNITVTGLTTGVYSVFATANVTGKVKSNVTQKDIEIVFTPADLNPQLWLDASDASTITESSGSVSQWNNKGSLSNFAQATGANQPTTGNSTLNGLNVIEADGDNLIAANRNEWKFMHDGTKYLFAAVFRREQNPTNVLLSNISSETHNGVLFDTRDDVAPDVKSVRHSVFRGVAGSFVVSNRIQNVIDLDEWYITTIIGDPSNATAADRSEIFVDDGTAAKNNTLTNAVSTANPSRDMNVFGFGTDGSNSASFEGKLAEMIVVSGANATETNRALIRDYLNNKWGVYS
jgi:hypothetical protein